MGPPEALFTIEIATEEGKLPLDTTVAVRWSAGEEPAYVLNDPTTHKTLEDGSNVVCQPGGSVGAGGAGGMGGMGGQGGGLAVLSCQLWTSGTTEVTVTATGYPELLETLKPETLDGCDSPIPSDVELILTSTSDET